jgi:aminoglycoside phosphotransferase (APT) family kinase protein
MEAVSGDRLTRFPAAVKKQVFYELGPQIAKLLKGRTTGYGWITLARNTGAYRDWRTFLTDFTDRYTAVLIKKGIISRIAVEKLKVRLHSLPQLEPALVHRDLKPNNILVKNGHLGAILDWENAILGDNLFDLGVIVGRLGKESEATKAVIKGYEKEVGNIDRNRLELYSLVALIGEVDFRLKHGLPITRYAARLHRTLQQVGICRLK